MQSGTDPTKHHVAILPAPHVARVMGKQAVQILDGIGAPEGLVESPVDTKGGEAARSRRASD
jgi:hypothetical protein